MRDLLLLHTFLDHLHKTSALAVPPEDLTDAVDVVAARFRIAEGGGPGYEDLQHMKAAIAAGEN